MEIIFVEISVAQRPRQAVGKDPGGVVVSKCVHCPSVQGVVVSRWYLCGIQLVSPPPISTI